MLNREQRREKCGMVETLGNFGILETLVIANFS